MSCTTRMKSTRTWRAEVKNTSYIPAFFFPRFIIMTMHLPLQRTDIFYQSPQGSTGCYRAAASGSGESRPVEFEPFHVCCQYQVICTYWFKSGIFFSATVALLIHPRCTWVVLLAQSIECTDSLRWASRDCCVHISRFKGRRCDWGCRMNLDSMNEDTVRKRT
jgi:hypothetical protein